MLMNVSGRFKQCVFFQAPVVKMPFIGMYLIFVVILSQKINCVIFNHDTKNDYTICDSDNICVRKCCAKGYVFKNTKCTFLDEYEFSFLLYEGTEPITTTNHTISVIHDRNCSDGRSLKLATLSNKKDLFFIQKNGSMFKPNDPLMKWTNFERFCLEKFVLSTGDEFSALVCYETKKLVIIESHQFTTIGKYFCFNTLDVSIPRATCFIRQ